MNDKGREALVKAALDGVEQTFGAFMQDEKRCAVGVLMEAAGNPQFLSAVNVSFDLRDGPQACPACDESGWSEMNLIMHLNDAHRFDFLTIARKLA
jgi:hypothetical protein